MYRVTCKLIALLLLAGLLAAAWVFPLPKYALAAAMAAYALLLWWRRHAWLMAVPALLPVLDLAPWTGWFFLDELDLLLLATAAIGYARLGGASRAAVLPPMFKVLIALLALCTTISAIIGLLPLVPADATAFATYASPYNSVRVAKGTWWALILLPLLRDSAGPDLDGLRRYLLPGMLIGLGLTACAVIWERLVFPGLLNFASDYRPTAPFSAMHTGGAALDAYLALSFPFVAGSLVLARTTVQRSIAALLFLLGCFAGLSLFSRDIYLAYGLTAAILTVFLLSRGARQGRFGGGAIVAGIVLLAVTALALHRAFESGGYRLLACALIVLGAAFVLAGAPQRLRHRLPCAALALGLCGLTLGITNAFDKGAYIAFIGAAACFAAGAAAMLNSGSRRSALGTTVAAAALPAIALAAVLVGQHWGGSAARMDGALVVAWAAILLATARLLPAQPVRLDQRGLMAALVCVIGFATIIPITSSYYLGSRWATTSADLDVRLRHWSEALDMMDNSLTTTVFGMGLGRYPEVYAWHNTHGELPSTLRYTRADGHPALELGAPQYSAGYGEVIRMLQHVPLEHGRAYRFEADVKRHGNGGTLAVAVCERWMLYPQHCVPIPAKLTAAADSWQHIDSTIIATELGFSGWLAPPVQLELSADGAASSVTLTRLSLRDAATGKELLRNGDFAEANTGWFFSSDRNHFPWHIKNVAVNSVFEQGWAGTAILLMFVLYLAGDLLMRCSEGEAQAAVYLAALGSFLLTGLFDSLFDVPRLTLMFLLVAWAAGLRAAPLRRAIA
ncbi:hypothetical protein [Massilia sp. PWRC2]|uniref:hypothetical protein n=1 Tax=Massilia sp. PWRC2 TaxID=2804626 RepID=UPI003CF7E4DD